MSITLKQKAIQLRIDGLTYSEIAKRFSPPIPKGTLSGWLKSIIFSDIALEKIKKKSKNDLKRAQNASLVACRKKQKIYFAKLQDELTPIAFISNQIEIKKLLLAVLYLGEGKKQKGSLCLGNANPDIIRFYLNLLRSCYSLDEKKFRVTAQCRADQDIMSLEKFWSKHCGVSLSQFYRARVDNRSKGKQTMKESYKGVCRIDYFSAEVFNELTLLAKMIMKGS